MCRFAQSEWRRGSAGVGAYKSGGAQLVARLCVGSGFMVKENDTCGNGTQVRQTDELAEYTVMQLHRLLIQVTAAVVVDAGCTRGTWVARLLMSVERRQQQHGHEHCQEHPCWKTSLSGLSQIHFICVRSVCGCKGSKNNHQVKEKSSLFVCLL